MGWRNERWHRCACECPDPVIVSPDGELIADVTEESDEAIKAITDHHNLLLEAYATLRRLVDPTEVQNAAELRDLVRRIGVALGEVQP